MPQKHEGHYAFPMLKELLITLDSGRERPEQGSALGRFGLLSFEF
jgi:hypothetical protein